MPTLMGATREPGPMPGFLQERELLWRPEGRGGPRGCSGWRRAPRIAATVARAQLAARPADAVSLGQLADLPGDAGLVGLVRIGPAPVQLPVRLHQVRMVPPEP